MIHQVTASISDAFVCQVNFVFVYCS